MTLQNEKNDATSMSVPGMSHKNHTVFHISGVNFPEPPGFRVQTCLL